MSFFGSLFGSDQRKAIKQSSATASKALQQGYDTGRTDITSGADKAYGYLDPFVASGGKANALLMDALGVNGPEAQARYYSEYQHDPGFEAEMAGGVKALDTSATARGGLYSGNAMKAVSDYGRTKIGESFTRRINALMPIAAQGGQMAGAAAGVASNTGNTLGSLSFGFGQQKAANAINRGNALAQAANIGPQNMLNLAGTAMKAFGIPGMK